MKNLLVLLTSVLMIINLSCFNIKIERGKQTTKTFDSFNFSELQISNSANVKVKKGDTYNVVVTLDSNLFNNYEVITSGNKLICRFKNNFFGFADSPKIEITMPNLEGIYISGATTLELMDSFSGESFDCEISGASTLKGSLVFDNINAEISGASICNFSLQVNDFIVETSGASTLTVNGTIENANIELSGASNYKGKNARTNNFKIMASGASSVETSVGKKISGKLSGSSNLIVNKDAQIEVSTEGASSITYK